MTPGPEPNFFIPGRDFLVMTMNDYEITLGTRKFGSGPGVIVSGVAVSHDENELQPVW